MKRYFFNIKDGGWEPDAIGTEFPDDDAAQREAIRFVGEVLKGEPHRLTKGGMRVYVHDQELSVGFAVEVTLIKE